MTTTPVTPEQVRGMTDLEYMKAKKAHLRASKAEQARKQEASRVAAMLKRRGLSPKPTNSNKG